MNDENELEEFGTDIEHDDIRKVSSTPKTMVVENEQTSKVEDKTKFDYIQWTNVGDGVFTYTGNTQPQLKSGAYTYYKTQGRLFLTKIELQTDELLEFKDSITDNVIEEIEKFWDSKEIFKKYKFLHRRGYIFYGGAGGGKTSTIQLIIKRIIARNGIVLLCSDPDYLSELTKIIRAIEPNRHIVCIFEDIDAIIRGYGDSGLLSFLDGEGQIDDILNIATTNYPERLDPRIISRPRRFDKRVKINPPSESVRREFFTKKLNVSEEEVEQYVIASKDFTFAAMSDLVIQAKCLDITFENAIENIKKLTTGKKPSSDEEKGSVGFN